MKISYVLIAAVILCSACSKNRKAPNGFEVKVIREGEGSFAKPGQFLVMNMLYKDTKDSVWDDTKKRQIPVIVPIPDTATMKNEKGLESAFRVLKKGDSVMLKESAKEFFENSGRPLPANIKPDLEISFFFGVTDILDEAGLNQLQTKIQTRENEKNRLRQEGQLAIDSTAIDAYLASKNIKALKGKSGVRYVVTKQGTGPTPTLTNTVRVSYKGSLLENGSVFDQSQAPVEFPLSNMIQGWQIGFQLLPKGTSATLYIPSSLGYGINGYPPDIPANANLVFEVELIDFK